MLNISFNYTQHLLFLHLLKNNTSLQLFNTK